MRLPQGEKISTGTTRFNHSKVHEAEREQGLDLPPLTGMVTDRQLAERYGVSRATIWRWVAASREQEE